MLGIEKGRFEWGRTCLGGRGAEDLDTCHRGCEGSQVDHLLYSGYYHLASLHANLPLSHTKHNFFVARNKLRISWIIKPLIDANTKK
jgi:hypothetical protein